MTEEKSFLSNLIDFVKSPFVVVEKTKEELEAELLAEVDEQIRRDGEWQFEQDTAYWKGYERAFKGRKLNPKTLSIIHPNRVNTYEMWRTEYDRRENEKINKQDANIDVWENSVDEMFNRNDDG